MLGHYYKPDHKERIFLSYLLKDFDKDVARTSGSKQRLSLVTTCGDEMKIAAAVIAQESFWHGSRLYKPKTKTE